MAAGSNNIVTDGLVCCWDGGNRRCGTPSAGGTWTGLGVNAPATLVNSAEFEDISLGAIAFDGTDDKVTVANTTDINGQNGFTFGIWLYFLATPNDDYTCFSIYNGGATGGLYEFMLYIMDVSEHTKSIMLGTRGTSNSSLRSDNSTMSPSNNIGKWVHYCATYNGDGANTPTNYKIYFNGQDMGSDGTTDFGGGSNTTRWGDDNGYGELNGYIGRVAFYNRPLSADEVSQNYEATKPRFVPRITKSNLELNFDAGDPESYSGGTTWKDTANGISAVLQNMEADDFNSSNGGYLEFDGTDEFAIVAQSGGWSMQGWAALTMETWINVAGSRWHRILYENQNDASTYSFRVGTDLYGTASAFWLAAGSSASVAESSFFSTDVWFQYVCRWDGTTMNVYKNGVKVGSGTSNSGTIESSSGTKGGVAIGAGWNSVNGLQSASETFYGKMGLLRVYQGALSDAEILDNYNKTKARFGH